MEEGSFDSWKGFPAQWILPKSGVRLDRVGEKSGKCLFYETKVGQLLVKLGQNDFIPHAADSPIGYVIAFNGIPLIDHLSRNRVGPLNFGREFDAMAARLDEQLYLLAESLCPNAFLGTKAT